MSTSRKFKGTCEHFFSSQKPWYSLSNRIWNPPTDVYETKSTIIIKMEVAGLKEEDLEITTEENLLVIRGERLEEKDMNEVNIHRLEVNYGKFERVFELPMNIIVEEIKADYRNGFLRVAIQKKNVKPQPVSIEVQTEE